MNFITAGFEVPTMIGILTRPLTLQEENIAEFRDYYAGKQGVRLTERQKKYLKCDSDMADAFVNVSKMVPNTLLDRLGVVPGGQGIIAIDDASRDFADLASNWWVDRGLDSIQNELHKFVLRDGAAALFVEWFDNQPLFTAKPIYANKTVEGVRFHSEENATSTSFDFCSYQWPVNQYNENGEILQDTLLRLNLYTRPEVEGGGALIYRFKSTDGGSWVTLDEQEIENELGFVASNPQELPIGHIPIVKFVNIDQLSEIADVFRLQQLINKSVGDIDISSDYHSYPLIAAEEFPNATDQKIEPGSLIRAKGAKRIEPANIEMMWKGTVLQYVDMISLVKRWPMWLLNPRDFSVPSGTALRVAERPLVSQIREKQNSLSTQWRLSLAIAKEWHNAESSANVEGQVNIKWLSASTENVIEDNEIIVRTAKEAGLPDESIWEQTLGLNTQQIEGILDKLEDDPDHKLQQSRIILRLSQALVDISVAAEFAGVEPSQAGKLATFGNAEPRAREVAPASAPTEDEDLDLDDDS